MISFAFISCSLFATSVAFRSSMLRRMTAFALLAASRDWS